MTRNACETALKCAIKFGRDAASTVITALDHQPLLHQEDSRLIPYMLRGQAAQGAA